MNDDNGSFGLTFLVFGVVMALTVFYYFGGI